MCCFSRPIERVSATRIFARPVAASDDGATGRQLLVYGMTLDVSEDVAMILPIPVPAGSDDDAVRFVDMSGCPSFFDALSAIFPAKMQPQSFGSVSRGGAPRPATLVVHDVGEFEASFVPGRRDFDRLDPRFRLPGDVWEQLPAYYDWGFCVFKLRAVRTKGSGFFGMFKSKTTSTGDRKIHPMAFEFPRRDPSSLFFPTVHVHDGTVHPTADFDHELFCQTPPDWEPLMEWERSSQRAGGMLHGADAWTDPAGWMYRRFLKGDLPNRDTYLVEQRLRARTSVCDVFRVRMKANWEHVVDDARKQLDPKVKRWIRVSEAERMRIRESVTAQLGRIFDEKKEAWGLVPFVHDGDYQVFEASNERLEPQEVNVAFAQKPPDDVRSAVQKAVQDAFDRASAEHRITVAPPA